MLSPMREFPTFTDLVLAVLGTIQNFMHWTLSGDSIASNMVLVFFLIMTMLTVGSLVADRGFEEPWEWD